jgi:hypothetical protein
MRISSSKLGAEAFSCELFDKAMARAVLRALRIPKLNGLDFKNERSLSDVTHAKQRLIGIYIGITDGSKLRVDYQYSESVSKKTTCRLINDQC